MNDVGTFRDQELRWDDEEIIVSERTTGTADRHHLGRTARLVLYPKRYLGGTLPAADQELRPWRPETDSSLVPSARDVIAQQRSQPLSLIRSTPPWPVEI